MKYQVYMTACASTSVEVEAENVEDAIEAAHDAVYVSLCHQCSGEVEIGDEWQEDSVYDNETDKLVWDRRQQEWAK